MRRFFIALGFVLLAGACDDGGTSAPGDASPWPADAPWEDAALSGDAAAFDACLSCGDAPATPIDAAKDGGGEGSADAGLDAGPGDPTDAGPGDAHPPAHVDLRFERQFPIKAFASGQRFVVVLERPLHLTTEYGWPARSVRWIEADGRVVRSRGSSGLRYLLDVAVHPSGQTTLLFASNEGFSLERTDAEGALLGTFVLNDPAVDTDPPAFPPPDGPITRSTYDVGRIAAAGERVVLVTRTGRHAVLAYGLTYEGGDRFGQSFRTLVVPPLAMPAIGLTGGSYDTFGLVGAQFAVHLAVGPEGLIYVGVRYPEISPRSLVRAHQNTFGETLATDPDGLDSYVTRLSAGGVRLGTSVVKIPATGDELEPHDELQSLHAVPGAVWLAGRTELWNPQGTGHDVLLARIDGGSGAVQSWRIDLDRGDIAFGVVPLDTTRFVIVGAQGYTQNPQGASVSEAATGFARVWSPTAGLGASLPVPSGPRHNQTRLALPLAGGRLLLGGMIDGPGTHSADGDIGKLRADGYLVTGP